MATAMRVPTIFTAVDRFSHVVARMSKSVSAFGETTQASAMRTSRGLSSFGTSMLTGGVAIATGLGYAINEAGKFEKAISNISTLTENTPEQMRAIGDSILDISKKVPVAISDLTSGMYDVVSAGITGTANQLEVLNRSSILAVAGLGTTKEAVNITTSSLNAFGISASKAESVTNLLMKAVKYGKTTVSGLSEGFGANAALIKNSNVTLEEYLSTTATLTTTGMTAARAQTQVASAVGALIKPSGTMSKIYAKLGVKDVPAFIKANGGLVGTMEVIKKTSNAMGLTLAKAFGRKEGFSALLSLLGPLSDKYKEVQADMASGSDIVNTAFAKQQKTFSAGVQRMKNSLGVLAIKIGEELIPRVNGFIESLTSAIGPILKFMKNNEWLVTVLANLAIGLLTIGALAKVGAVFFYSYAKGIQAYRWALDLGTKAILRWQLASLTAMETGGSFIVALLGWPAIIALGVLALGGLAYAMSMSSETVGKFAKNNELHLNIVSGKYESMESRIAKSNDRIVASMKKFKLDLESVEKTGKTVAEIAQEKIRAQKIADAGKAFRAFIPKGISADATGINMPKVRGIREVSPEELSVYSTAGLGKHKNLAGTINPLASDIINSIKGVSGTVNFTVESKDGSKVDVDTSKATGVKVITTPTQGQRQ